ncbi:MAG: efflux RND transporter periplasmic adaptor subunit [Vicinamibacteria bacterium]|nr:efflux RND transporter periplasmic adaptor subunit [Vicinamibacteria bacterium]
MFDEVEKPFRRRRPLLIVVLAVVLGLGGVGILRQSGGVSEAQAATAAPAEKAKDEMDKKEAALVALAPVEVGAVSAYLVASANLVAEDEVKLVAEAEGRVVELLAEEGAFVQKGQKLVQIDRADAQLAVQKAELGLRNASLTWERNEKMAAEKLVSPQDVDKARYERDVAKHALDEARRRLEKTEVRAPFAGKVTLRSVQNGQTVKPGDALFTLADYDPLVARIFLPEREVLDLKPGQEAQMSLKARDDVRFRGRIQRISPVVDTQSGTVKVTVEAVQPPASVRPGAFVTVGLVRETRPQALLVPKPAVIRELSEAFVFVADGDKARRKAVQTGLEEGDKVEIIGGLAKGERVITSGQGALKDGAPIRVAKS